MFSFRSPRTMGAALLAASLTVAGLAVTTPTSQASGSVPPSALGMFVGFDRGDRFADMERRLELPIKWVLTMADSRSASQMLSSVWGQLEKPGAYLPGVANRVNLAMSIPVGFGPGGQYEKPGGQETVRRNLLAVASGQHDESYRRVARYLIDAGYEDAVLRLGHEFDGTWEPYSARGNNDAYIAAFRRVHDVFARESAAFRFEWTSMQWSFRQYGPPAYPGDGYVDIVGMDVYYREPGPITDAVWKNQYLASLTAHRDFAAGRGKPVSYSEWGRAMGNEGKFVSLMHGWFSSLPSQGPGSLVYQSYFNETWADYDLAKLTVVRQTYIDLFGRKGATNQVTPPPTVPVQTAPPATAPPATAPPATAPPATAPPATPAPSTPSALLPAPVPAERLALVSDVVTSTGTATRPTVKLTPASTSIALEWIHAETPRVNVRYRKVGVTDWYWVPNGSRKQQFTGLTPGATYEVQVRLHLGGQWQDWTTAIARTGGPSVGGLAAPDEQVVAQLTTSVPVIALSSRSGALGLSWFHPGDGRRNVRYRSLDSSTWTWVPNGSWNQVISGLRPNTAYEVQVRVHANETWQPWATATATTS